ncbi:hypothetical protein SteCoe_35165 [Stentor coeruleus]|uniref:Translin-associated factor X-interacting protein 1 N-terminal domain-containing protein n=1 Tax=Stentor coeruleus TaxID=5963 RepID=A0A1R2ASY8_9CILI|nr:hypothetical protein SteCoe_35165 [Stentor coeruleus]
MSNAMKQSFSVGKPSQRFKTSHKDKLALNSSIEIPKISEQKLPQIKQSSLSPYSKSHAKSYKKLECCNKKPVFSYSKKQVINYEPKRQDKKLYYSHSLASCEGGSIVEVKSPICDTVSDMVKIIEGQNNMQKKLEACEEVFEEIIDKDKEFSVVLKVIKKEYENVISCQSITLKKQTCELLELENIKCELSSELEKMLETNKDLTTQLQNINKKYNELSIKCLKNLDKSLNQSEDDIKKMYKENKNYLEVLKKQSNEMKYYKIKAKKMMELLLALEKNGYPVEKVYNSEIRKIKIIEKDAEGSIFLNETKDKVELNEKIMKFDTSYEIPLINTSKIDNCSFISDSEADFLLSFIKVKE